MDDLIDVINKIVDDYQRIEILNTEKTDTILEISMQVDSEQYTMWLIKENDELLMPLITVIDHSPHPHFLIREIKIKGKMHSSICLYEGEEYIPTLFSDQEKISFSISQLLRLINLTPTQIEKEYQKEFLYYWNHYTNSNTTYDLYLDNERQFAWLNHFSISEKYKCFIHENIYMNSYFEKKLKFKESSDVLYIPIEDVRGIIPPTKEHMWDLENILDIIDNKQMQRISYDLYCTINDLSYSKKSIILVFMLNSLVFGCEIVFKNKGTAKLIKKIKGNFQSLVLLRIKRRDFYHLNSQIGNDLKLYGKKIAIVGAGSLGSYISKEIVKAGIKDLTIIDGDTFTIENIMRHQLDYYCDGAKKTTMLEISLCLFHPQIKVRAIKDNLSIDNINEYINEDIDIVIFAVGASSFQLSCNRYFAKNNYNKLVLYTWLEPDGKSGHVLGIDYSKEGCFECLFTNTDGNYINNKVNVCKDEDIEVNLLHNGCGGTRVAYGNSILLNTTDLLLSALRHICSNDFSENFVYSVNNKTIDGSESFYEKRCRCCCDRT